MSDFVLIARRHYQNPESLFIQFYPWKNYLKQVQPNTEYLVVEIVGSSPSPMLLWGLHYSAQGKESIFQHPIYMIEGSLKDNSKCRLLLDLYYRLEACKKV